MKKIRILLLLITSIISLSTSFAYGSDDFRPEWGCSVENRWNNWSHGDYRFNGRWNDFVVYSSYNAPWCFAMRVKANGSWPSKSAIKEYKKSGKNFVYDATIEYWVCDKYPTIKDILKTSSYGIKLVNNPEALSAQEKKDLGNIVKRTAKGKLYLLPWRDMIKIFFDDIAIGIDIRNATRW